MLNKVVHFPYKNFFIKDRLTGEIKGQISRPMVSIRISYGHRLSLLFDALVDSGCDRNLFPAIIGEEIGINFKKAKPIVIGGIGDSFVKAFPIRVKLFLGIASYETIADFSYEQKIPLLGRSGFFNLFKSIKFDEQEKFFYIQE